MNAFLAESLNPSERLACWGIALTLHVGLLSLPVTKNGFSFNKPSASGALVSVEYLKEAPRPPSEDIFETGSVPGQGKTVGTKSERNPFLARLMQGLEGKIQTPAPKTTALAGDKPSLDPRLIENRVPTRDALQKPSLLKDKSGEISEKELSSAQKSAKALAQGRLGGPSTPDWESPAPRLEEGAVAEPDLKKNPQAPASPHREEMRITGSPTAAFQIEGPLHDRDMVKRVLPEYPEWAEKEGINATVGVHVTILPSGRVKENAYVTKTSGYPALDLEAVKAVKEWEFVPVPGSKNKEEWAVVTFRFMLYDRRPENVRRERQAESEELYARGLEAYSQGRIQDAVRLWEKTLEYNPWHQEAKRGLERIQGKRTP